nr:MAG TPA: hypothetical protein [Caudoviricetes sp.]DAY99610.1 MAG TPA: hypothetical protein [Caudoviricetes sp.]
MIIFCAFNYSCSFLSINSIEFILVLLQVPDNIHLFLSVLSVSIHPALLCLL